MSLELTPEQQELKSKIVTTAVIWAVVVGLVAALIVFWLGANAPDWVRWVLTLIVGGVAAYLTYRLSYNSGVAKSVCRKCGTAFGIREVERHEEVVGIEQKRKVEPGRAATKTDRGTTKTTTWTEEKVEVTAIDECFKCHNRTERKWTTTRDKDKVESEAAA